VANAIVKININNFRVFFVFIVDVLFHLVKGMSNAVFDL
jgi:hypothetical protein